MAEIKAPPEPLRDLGGCLDLGLDFLLQDWSALLLALGQQPLLTAGPAWAPRVLWPSGAFHALACAGAWTPPPLHLHEGRALRTDASLGGYLMTPGSSAGDALKRMSLQSLMQRILTDEPTALLHQYMAVR